MAQAQPPRPGGSNRNTSRTTKPAQGQPAPKSAQRPAQAAAPGKGNTQRQSRSRHNTEYHKESTAAKENNMMILIAGSIVGLGLILLLGGMLLHSTNKKTDDTTTDGAQDGEATDNRPLPRPVDGKTDGSNNAAGTGKTDGKTDGAASTDGAATDGKTDGAATDGAATDGSGTDGAATDGSATDGAATDDGGGDDGSDEPDEEKLMSTEVDGMKWVKVETADKIRPLTQELRVDDPAVPARIKKELEPYGKKAIPFLLDTLRQFNLENDADVNCAMEVQRILTGLTGIGTDVDSEYKISPMSMNKAMMQWAVVLWLHWWEKNKETYKNDIWER